MAWNRQSEDGANTQGSPRKSKAKTSLVRGLVAAGVVILGGGIAIFLLTGRDAGERPTERAQAKAAKAAEKRPAAAKPAAAPERRPADDKSKTNAVTVVKSQVVTNATGAIVERQVLSNGKKVTKVRPPEPVFKNASDQLIALTLNVKPGQAMAPLPDLSSVDADFVKSLMSPIRIEDGDSDEVKDLKGRVMEARAYLSEEVKAGKTVREALKEYQAELEKFADSHLMAIQEIQKIRESDGDAAARDFRDRVNESFRARGIPELEAPERISKQRRKSK